ncbi:MAG: transposase, partial [Planctomycetes bacterium]|nr:transposase [Planctomycetota bacterium]
LEKFNNETAKQVAADPQARFGAKGKSKFWYGYKRHTSVDMQSGLINKVAATPANVTDAQGTRHICPDQGAVIGPSRACYAYPARQWTRATAPSPRKRRSGARAVTTPRSKSATWRVRIRTRTAG